MMKKCLVLWLALVALLCVSCGEQAASCPRPAGTRQYLSGPPALLPAPPPNSAPAPMKIGGKSVLVGRVITGPLCNDTWSGVVYVSCDVQVYPWEGQPTFLKNCNLIIEPGTVVYVAAHGDEPYYKGCSCHTEVTKQ